MERLPIHDLIDEARRINVLLSNITVLIWMCIFLLGAQTFLLFVMQSQWSKVSVFVEKLAQLQ